MKFKVSGKNIAVTDALRDRVENKMVKLEKFFYPDTEVHATLSVEKNRQIIEITIPFKGIVFRTEQSNDDMYSAIDKAIDVLGKQIVKNKTKLEKRFKGEPVSFEYLSKQYGEDVKEEDYKVIKKKKFEVKPMPADEAIMEMNLLGHEFFVFRNSDTDVINVIYRRKDGNYGLIEPEA